MCARPQMPAALQRCATAQAPQKSRRDLRAVARRFARRCPLLRSSTGTAPFGPSPRLLLRVSHFLLADGLYCPQSGPAAMAFGSPAHLGLSRSASAARHLLPRHGRRRLARPAGSIPDRTVRQSESNRRAARLGLGTCWLGRLSPWRCRDRPARQGQEGPASFPGPTDPAIQRSPVPLAPRALYNTPFAHSHGAGARDPNRARSARRAASDPTQPLPLSRRRRAAVKPRLRRRRRRSCRCCCRRRCSRRPGHRGPFIGRDRGRCPTGRGGRRAPRGTRTASPSPPARAAPATSRRGAPPRARARARAGRRRPTSGSCAAAAAAAAA